MFYYADSIYEVYEVNEVNEVNEVINDNIINLYTETENKTLANNKRFDSTLQPKKNIWNKLIDLFKIKK